MRESARHVSSKISLCNLVTHFGASYDKKNEDDDDYNSNQYEDHDVLIQE